MTARVYIDCRSSGDEHWSFNIPIICKARRNAPCGSKTRFYLPSEQLAILRHLGIRDGGCESKRSILELIRIIRRENIPGNEIILLNINPLHLISLAVLEFKAKVSLYLHNEIFAFDFSIKALTKFYLWGFALRSTGHKICLICSSRYFSKLLSMAHGGNLSRVIKSYELLEPEDWQTLASNSSSVPYRLDYLYLGSLNRSRGAAAFDKFLQLHPTAKIAACGFRLSPKTKLLNGEFDRYERASPYLYAKLLLSADNIVVCLPGKAYRMGTSGIVSDAISAGVQILFIEQPSKEILRRVKQAKSRYAITIVNGRRLIIRDGKIGDHMLAMRYLIENGLEDSFYFSLRSKSVKAARIVSRTFLPSVQPASVLSREFFLSLGAIAGISWYCHPRPNPIYSFFMAALSKYTSIDLEYLAKEGTQYDPLGRQDALRAKHMQPLIHSSLGKYVVLAPESSEASKDMSANFVKSLLARLPSTKYINDDVKKIVLIGTQRIEVGNITSSVEIVNMCGQTDFAEMVNIIQHAMAVITVDSAPAHIAAYFGKNTIVFQHQKLREDYWYPSDPWVRNLTLPAIGCRGCEKVECPYGSNYCVSGNTLE
jgi:Glycosyltransferase family 9 (heptosyltransferase)